MTLSYQNMRPEKVPELIALAERAGAAHQVPMFRAAGMGLVRLVMAGPQQRFPVSLLDMQKHPQPAIVTLGGDGSNAIGPEGFPQAWIDLKQRTAPATKGIVFQVPGGRPPHLGQMCPAQARAVFQ